MYRDTVQHIKCISHNSQHDCVVPVAQDIYSHQHNNIQSDHIHTKYLHHFFTFVCKYNTFSEPINIFQGSHSNLIMKIQDFFEDLIYQTISTYFYTVMGTDL